MRPIEEIKQDPRWLALGVQESNAVLGACIDYLHKGQHKTQRQNEQDAAALRNALTILSDPRTREVLEHNLGGRVIHDPETGKSLTLAPWLLPDESPVGSGVVLDAVFSVIKDHAESLEHPHNIDFTERNNRHYLTFLGRGWRRAGLEHPGIQRLREIVIIVMGSDDLAEDPDLLKAFRNGWQVSKKSA
ncbi:hypothetical protein HFV02_05390 [Acidithiobacillus caldus]|uniref:hypothetical protein n=1 Tax=Acidithiobacillus caldus TaxID=33059 RepID=UPI001C0746B6|nr:hypothetical protein [Acidithiobacillus caldus]MBU2801697.1 hypothetical protein [Acidithiobacillus caldus]